MSVEYVAHGGPNTSVNGGTFANAASPATQEGDIRLLFITATNGGVVTPAGWALLASNTESAGLHSWVFYRRSTAPTAAGNVTVTHTAGISRATILVLRGASEADPIATINFDPDSFGGFAFSETMQFTDFAVMCVVAPSSPTISGQASSTGLWVPTERFDSVLGGVVSMSLTTGPISLDPEGWGDILFGQLSSTSSSRSITMAVSVSAPSSGPGPLPLRQGADQVDALRYGTVEPSALYRGSTLIWPV